MSRSIIIIELSLANDFLQRTLMFQDETWATSATDPSNISLWRRCNTPKRWRLFLSSFSSPVRASNKNIPWNNYWAGPCKKGHYVNFVKHEILPPLHFRDGQEFNKTNRFNWTIHSFHRDMTFSSRWVRLVTPRLMAWPNVSTGLLRTPCARL